MIDVATQIAVALLGCWEPVTSGRFGEMTCVTLGAESSEIRITSIVPGSPVTEQVLRLDGSRRAVTLTGCDGWEIARPSADGQRIVISAEVRCGAGPVQRRSGAFAITPDGEWLHAEGRGIATISDVQLRILRPAAVYGGVPQQVREALEPVMDEAVAARVVLATARVTAADLVELDDMALDGKIIDVVVAANHPKSFVLGVGGGAAIESVDGTPGPRTYAMYPMYGFGYPAFYFEDLAFLYGCANPYGGYFFTSYGDRRFCSAYNYWTYDSWRRGGYYAWTGGYPYGPVVIKPTQPSGAGGRVVRGQGYTKPGTTTGTRTAEPRSAGSSGSSTATTRSGGGSSGASAGSGSRSSGGSTASSSGGGRTAQPRKP